MKEYEVLEEQYLKKKKKVVCVGATGGLCPYTMQLLILESLNSSLALGVTALTFKSLKINEVQYV